MSLYTTYQIKCNQTDETWSNNFNESDARFIGAPESIIADGGLNQDQANRFVASMNRAQQNYKNEFTFSLN
jgi:polyhydroxyalkanoate synthesis regulator phasin